MRLNSRTGLSIMLGLAAVLYPLTPGWGQVLEQQSAETIKFRATKERGPWSQSDRNPRTMAVIPSCASDSAGTEFVRRLSETLPGLVTQQLGIKALSSKDLEKFLLASQLPRCPKPAEEDKVFWHALSFHDFAVRLFFQGGWLWVQTYHAISPTEAKSSYFGVLLGKDPSVQDADSEAIKYLGQSIKLVMQAGE